MVATLNQALLVEENFSTLLLGGPQQPSYPEMAYKLSGKGVDAGGGGEGEGGGGEGEGGGGEGGGGEGGGESVLMQSIGAVPRMYTSAPLW
jgi:hypothetical protein